MSNNDTVDEQLLLELGDNPSIRRAIRLFELVGMPARNLSQRTREEYGKDLRLMATFCEGHGRVQADQLTLPLMETYQAEMDNRGYASASRQRKTYAIRAFLSFLHRQGIMAQDIGRRLIPPRRTKKEPRFLTRSEYQALMRACQHDPRDAAIIELLLQTGIRRAEVVRLTLDDILELPERPTPDPDNVGYIHVRRQGSKEVTIPLNYKSCVALRRYLTVRPSTEIRAVFLSRYGTPLSPRAVLNVVKQCAARAGLPGVGVHTLRHTHGTHHAMQGTDLRTIQANMGHASISTTELYVDLAKRARRRALQEHAL